MTRRQPASQPPPRLAYRPSEVAEMLGVGRSTVFEWCRLGRLATVKIDRVLLVPAKEVEELLQRYRIRARPGV